MTSPSVWRRHATVAVATLVAGLALAGCVARPPDPVGHVDRVWDYATEGNP